MRHDLVDGHAARVSGPEAQVGDQASFPLKHLWVAPIKLGSDPLQSRKGSALIYQQETSAIDFEDVSQDNTKSMH
jgi:hypothetical protein